MTENVVYFQGQPIRTVEEDGVVWYIVSDVCRILGYQHSNTTVMLSRLPQDCHRKYAIGRFRTQTNTVNKNGLVMLTMRSRTIRARDLQAWIVSGNLPSIGALPESSAEDSRQLSEPFAVQLNARHVKDSLIIKLRRIRDLSDQFIKALQDF